MGNEEHFKSTIGRALGIDFKATYNINKSTEGKDGILRKSIANVLGNTSLDHAKFIILGTLDICDSKEALLRTLMFNLVTMHEALDGTPGEIIMK